MSLFDTGRGAPAVALTDLLSIEDAPDLLALHCPQTGIPVWPNLRIAFLRQIMGDLLYASGSAEPLTERRPLRAAGSLSRAVAHNLGAVLGSRLRSDVLINTDAIGDELRDGRWFNRYVDPFGDLLANPPVMLIDMFEWQWRTPRHNERVFYHAPTQVGAVLVAKLPGRADASRLAEAAVALACERAKTLIGWEMGEERRGAFVHWATRKIAGLPFRYRAYRRLMQRVQPRFLLGATGCYGAHAPLLAAAHDLGIVSAEYQHGAISAGHDAYNFAPAIFDSQAYRRTLPQYLLTYGAWWSAQVHAPVECVPIGNPARAAKLERMAASDVERRTILVLGDGVESDLYLDLSRTVARAVEAQGLDVAFRPHPLERTSVLHRHGESVDGVRIDIEPDIYASFMRAHTVISEVSTGLFEAVGLVDQIVLLNTARARFAYPRHPFTAANSTQEIIDLVCGEAPKTPKVGGTDLWAPEWRENYRQFLLHKVGIEA